MPIIVELRKKVCTCFNMDFAELYTSDSYKPARDWLKKSYPD
jgi:hypothetical protein